MNEIMMADAERQYSDRLDYEMMLHVSIQACQFAYRQGRDMQNEIGALEFLLSPKIKAKLNPRMEPILQAFEQKVEEIKRYDYRASGIHNKRRIARLKNLWLKEETRKKNGKEINELIAVLDELNMLLRTKAIPDQGFFSFYKDMED